MVSLRSGVSSSNDFSSFSGGTAVTIPTFPILAVQRTCHQDSSNLLLFTRSLFKTVRFPAAFLWVKYQGFRMSRAANHLLALAFSLCKQHFLQHWFIFGSTGREAAREGFSLWRHSHQRPGAEIIPCKSSCTDAQRNPAYLSVLTPTQVLEDFGALCPLIVLMNGGVKPWMSPGSASCSPSMFQLGTHGVGEYPRYCYNIKVPEVQSSKTKPFASGYSGWMQSLGAQSFPPDSAITSNTNHAEVPLMLRYAVWKTLWDLQTEGA